MTYFNPKIYNYKNLHEEDKNLIDYFDYAIESVENYEPIEWEGENNEKEPVLDRMKREIEQEFKEELLEYLKCERLENIVGVMDNYEEDIEEVEEE